MGEVARAFLWMTAVAHTAVLLAAIWGGNLDLGLKTLGSFAASTSGIIIASACWDGC